jgi:putative membrane protein
MMPYGYYGHGYGYGEFGMLHGIFGIVVFIGVLILLAMVVRHLMHPDAYGPHSTSTNTQPLDILKERFAKGEIDKAEYEERKEVLAK